MAITDVQGTLFQRSSMASPEVFSTVGEVTAIPEFNASRDPRDVTAINDSQFQYSPGMKNGGQITVSFRYDRADTAHIGFITDFEAKTVRNYKLVLADSPEREITFSGFVTSYTGPTGTPNDTVNMTVAIQITTGPVWGS